MLGLLAIAFFRGSAA